MDTSSGTYRLLAGQGFPSLPQKPRPSKTVSVTPVIEAPPSAAGEASAAAYPDVMAEIDKIQK